jgi:hypothetical protein
LLGAGRPQSGQTVQVDQALPARKFFDRQHVAAAGLFNRHQFPANSTDDLGLSANYPALWARSRQVRD